MLTIDRLTSKQLYAIFSSKISERPTSEARIENILNDNNIEWHKVYSLAREVTIDTFTRQFHFKLTHNILYLNKSLTRMGISDNKFCSFCNIVDETPIHIFSQCPEVISLWSSLTKRFNASN